MPLTVCIDKYVEICDISQGEIKFYTFMEPDYLIDQVVN